LLVLTFNITHAQVDSAKVSGFAQLLYEAQRDKIAQRFTIGQIWTFFNIYSGQYKLFAILSPSTTPDVLINFLQIERYDKLGSVNLTFRAGKFLPPGMLRAWNDLSPGDLLIPRHPIADSLVGRDIGIGTIISWKYFSLNSALVNGGEYVSTIIMKNNDNSFDFYSRFEMRYSNWFNIGVAVRRGERDQFGVDYWGEGKYWELSAGSIKHENEDLAYYIQPVVKYKSIKILSRYEQGWDKKGWSYGLVYFAQPVIFKMWFDGYTQFGKEGRFIADLELHF